MRDKIFRLFFYFVIFSCAVFAAIVIGFGFAWKAENIPTQISYHIRLDKPVYAELHKKLNAIATANDLTANGDDGDIHKREHIWKSKDKTTGVYAAILDPVDGTDVDVFAYTSDPTKEDDLLKMAKEIEKIASQMSVEIDISVSLNPALYGNCATMARPKEKDAVCIFHLTSVMDLNEIETLKSKEHLN